MAKDGQEKFPATLEELIYNPKILGKASPEEWYCHLKKTGCNPLPLGDG